MVLNLKKYHTATGFTLVELVLTMAIIGILAIIANDSYMSYRERVNYELAVADIRTIEQAIERYFVSQNQFPTTLDEVSLLIDPWGNLY